MDLIEIEQCPRLGEAVRSSTRKVGQQDAAGDCIRISSDAKMGRNGSLYAAEFI
jgi:hypothetical protein